MSGSLEANIPNIEPILELQVRLFGLLTVHVQGAPLPPLRTRKGAWLLALLILKQQHPLDRAWLAATLWPDSDQRDALKNLRNALTDLRRALGPQQHHIHAPTPSTLRLDLTNIHVDLLDFDGFVKANNSTSLAKAVVLYRGALLEGCEEEWIVLERQHRHVACLEALESLARFELEAGAPAQAARHLRTCIHIDPFRETAQCVLMTALAVSGDYAGVTQIYREFRLLLMEELHLQPTSETTSLYQKIRVQARQMAAGGATALPPPSLAPRRTTLPADVTPEPGEANSTEEGVSHNLPTPLTSFIGRDKECADLRRLLGSTRLLTLTGTGGSGKTRLALEIAGENVSAYADGVWLVVLDSLSDPSLVVQAVASVFDIREQSGQPLLQTLVSALRSKTLLLLLDNCEHLLKACGTLAATLLRACPSVQLLTTSRERLGIAGEQIYRVPSLSLPDLTDGVNVENLQGYESARLFVARACLTRSDFQVTPQNARALAQICHRLDGIPLAIELAAVWVKSLSVADLLHRLDDRFSLLKGGDRSALPRQQTLRGLFDWGYDLLSGPEQKLLQQLSVFAGGWTLEAAEFVCVEQGRGTGTCTGHAAGAIARHAFLAERGPALGEARGSPENRAENRIPSHFPGEILDLLSCLEDKSLVLAEERECEVRYRLLETVRQYAHTWLVKSGESDAVQKRHQDYFLALVEAAELKLQGAEQGEWLQTLERENENLRAALDRSLLERESTICLRFCGALSRFWRIRGRVSEGQEWCVRALGAAGAQQRSPERAKALNTLGGLAYSQGDYPSARTHYEEGLAIRKEIGDRLGIAQLLNNLGAVAFSQSDYTSARAYTEESLAVKREIGDRRGIADSLHNLGSMAQTQGDYHSAQTYHRESLALRREIGDRSTIAWSLNDLGSIANTHGDFDLARTYHKESLAIRREIGDLGGIAQSLEAFARLAANIGQWEEAAALWGAAEALREQIRSPQSPLEQAYNDQEAADARDSLGEEAFTSAWAKGRKMTIETAISLASARGFRL